MSEPSVELLSKRRLRAWLRMLGVARQVENHLREFLRVEHATTLPRFDVMAALHASGGPMSMSELSRRLLVSNGNATAVVDRLERDGLARRTPAPDDRRTVHVALTELGHRRFEDLAADHEREVNKLLAGLRAEDLDALRGVMHRLRPGSGTVPEKKG